MANKLLPRSCLANKRVSSGDQRGPDVIRQNPVAEEEVKLGFAAVGVRARHGELSPGSGAMY